MNFKHFCFAIILFSVLIICDSYDPAAEQAKRLETYRKTCQKYNDDLTYEYQVLFGTHVEPGAYFYNLKSKFAVCVSAKTSAQSWLLLMRRVQYYDSLNMNKEEWEELEKMDVDAWFAEAHKSIVVRHPLERILSAYRYSLADTSLLPDLTKKAFAHWLPFRDDPLTPEADEQTHVVVHNLNETVLSFRQFVNFLTKCPQETEDCALWANEGVAYHWASFWVHCSNPCRHDLKSIIHMSHAVEDKEYLFGVVGLNNSVPLEHKNKSGEEHSSAKEVVKKYYSRLLKSEIYDLYKKYQLDHELFGFSPDEFIAMGRDEIKK